MLIINQVSKVQLKIIKWTSKLINKYSKRNVVIRNNWKKYVTLLNKSLHFMWYFSQRTCSNKFYQKVFQGTAVWPKTVKYHPYLFSSEKPIFFWGYVLPCFLSLKIISMTEKTLQHGRRSQECIDEFLNNKKDAASEIVFLLINCKKTQVIVLNYMILVST